MNVRMIHRWGAAVLAGGLFLGALGALAQDASSTMPDAQIESNVLKALASAPELSTQNIQSSTVYGTVTLTGNVQDETMRTAAENLVARALGVKKVVDELSLGNTPPQANDQAGQPDENGAPAYGQPREDQSGPGQPDAGQNNQIVLQSNGTYAPAQGDAGPPPDGQQMQAPPPPPEGYQAQPGDQAQPGEQGPPPPGRQPMDQSYGQQPSQAPIPGGQQAGIAVTVPPGSMLRIRINRGLDSNDIRAGAPFDGTVLTDIVANGQVAIPRGATVSGVVVGAKKAGVFKGEGELSLQINNVTLGGQMYPLTTDVWTSTGRNKTPGTVGNTVGLGAFGALVGAIAGGGTGAAIGAGVGAGAGLAGSAASPRGQIIIPPESVLTFRTAGPATIQTVSEREMERLSYQAGPSQPNGSPRVRYYSPYYGYYYGPPR